jgi:capsular polysaccharide biosynthesis protein
VKAHEILRRLMRRLWLVLLLTAIGGGAGAAYAALKTPTYTAKAYVVATANAGDSISALNFAQAYGRVATSGPVLAKAGALLGADDSGLTAVTASTSPDAPVIEIDATGSSARHTADVANAVANALAAYGTVRRDQTHVGLALLAAALTPAKPSSPRPPLELIVGAAGGLLIGGLAVLAGVGRKLEDPDIPEGSAKTENAEPLHYTSELSIFNVESEVDDHLQVWQATYGRPAIAAFGSATPVSTTPVSKGPESKGPESAGPPERDAPAADQAPAGNEPNDEDEIVRELRPVSGAAWPFGAPSANLYGGSAAAAAAAREGAGAKGGKAREGATKKVNGTVYSPGPIVGRAQVAGMEDDDDDE